MKYVVTGGVGFIGSNLVDRLLKNKHQVIVIDNLESHESRNRLESSELSHWKHNKNLKILFDDISNMKDYKLFEGASTMFHFAALPEVQLSIKKPLKYHNANVNGTIKMLDACVQSKIKRFIFSSSSAVYGDAQNLPTKEESSLNPKSPYALHKIIGEKYCKLFEFHYGLETFSLRYFNVYGKRQPMSGLYCTVIGKFINQIIKNLPLTINGNGEQRRDFVCVKDVIEANMICSSIKHIKENVINIGSGVNHSINELASLLNSSYPTINKPAAFEPYETLADIDKATNMIDWTPKTELRTWINGYKEELGL